MKQYRITLMVIILIISTFLIDRMLVKIKDYGSDQLVEAFGSTPFTIQSMELNLWGEYMPKYMTKEEMHQITEIVAQRLGLIAYEETFETVEDKSIDAIEKKAVSANTRIQFVQKTEHVEGDTFVSRNYLTVTLTLYNQCKSMGYYEKILSQVFKELEVRPTKGLAITSTQRGKLSEKAAQIIMVGIIEALGGEVKDIYLDDAYHSAYGYSDNLKDYVVSKGEKVNMDLAMTYNEEEDMTYLYTAVPVITFEY